MVQKSQKRDLRREATRRLILDAATELAAAEGWPSVTMRKVADRVNYSHPALYAYFATKDDLLLALLLVQQQRWRWQRRTALALVEARREAAERANQAKSDFLADVAHEIRRDDVGADTGAVYVRQRARDALL